MSDIDYDGLENLRLPVNITEEERRHRQARQRQAQLNLAARALNKPDPAGWLRYMIDVLGLREVTR